MSSENWKILLRYKSERNVTKHNRNRACVLLFWKVKLLHVSLWQSTSVSISKLYSYNTSIGNPKFNVSDASRRLFSRFSKGWKHDSSYRGVKLYRKWPEGKRKLVQVSGSSSYRGFEWVTKGKITRNVWQTSRGNRFWFEFSARFELARVRVIGSRLYSSGRTWAYWQKRAVTSTYGPKHKRSTPCATRTIIFQRDNSNYLHVIVCFS